MFNVLEENTVSLREACGLLPGSRPGKRLTFSCIWRWVMNGSKAIDGTTVKLEAVRVGSRWLTSKEAVQRFVERLNAREECERPMPATPTQRRRTAESAKRTASAKGF